MTWPEAFANAIQTICLTAIIAQFLYGLFRIITD
jgi:hypothetical protein